MAVLSVGAHVIANRPLLDRSRRLQVSRRTPGIIVGRSGILVKTYRVKLGQGREQAIIDCIPARDLRLNSKSAKNKVLLRSPRKG